MNRADPLRVLHLTDPHLFAAPEGELRGAVTYRSLGRVLDDYRGSDWQADYVLVTGDIVQDDSPGAYQNFRELLGALGLPVYCVPGNHDVPGLMRDALAEPPFHYCESIAAGGWVIIPVDSCVSGKVHGRVSDAELERLTATMARHADAHVLVCLHHPPVLVHSRWLDSVGLENREQFLDTVAAASNARLVLFGHVHQDYEGEHAGLRILGTPSTCRQFAPRSALFAVDDNPPAYRRLNLYTDGRFEHELIWVNDEPV